jgi:hypothetical protein
MIRETSNNNSSFDYLSHSGEFLNFVLEHINSCVILLNAAMELQAFNNALKTIFSNKPDEHILYKKCGNVIGCAFAVEEEAECGSTSQCQFCLLRQKAIISYANNECFYKEKFSREFYKTNTEKVMKHLQFSTRSFQFEKDKYTVMIIEDISKFC